MRLGYPAGTRIDTLVAAFEVGDHQDLVVGSADDRMPGHEHEGLTEDPAEDGRRLHMALHEAQPGAERTTPDGERVEPQDGVPSGHDGTVVHEERVVHPPEPPTV